MVQLAHNVSKLNAQILQVTRSLKCNGSSAPDLLHQLFTAYLAWPYVKLNAYITLKQNSFEKRMTYKPDYLMYAAKIFIDMGLAEIILYLY